MTSRPDIAAIRERKYRELLAAELERTSRPGAAEECREGRGFIESVRAMDALESSLTAPLPEEIEEIERRHEGQVLAAVALGFSDDGSQPHKDRATLLQALRSLRAEMKEAREMAEDMSDILVERAIQGEREECAKVADECERVGAPPRAAAQLIRARKETTNA